MNNKKYFVSVKLCVNGVYSVLNGFIIGFDSLLFTTYNVRLRWRLV